MIKKMILFLMVTASLYSQNEQGKLYGFQIGDTSIAVDNSGIIRFIGNYDDIHNSSEGFLRFENEDKMGFLNTLGLVVIEPIFSLVSNFNGNYAGITTDNFKNGLINREGIVILEPEYSYLDVIDGENGYCIVRSENKYGVIDNSNQVIIPFSYDFIGDYTEGLLPVRKNNKYGFIDIHNRLIIPFDYDHVEPFSEGLASVEKSGRQGFIDRDGNVVIDFNFLRTNSFHEGYAAVFLGERKENDYSEVSGCTFIDKKGNYLFPPQEFADVGLFSEGLARVRTPLHIERAWGFINKDGELVIDYMFDSVSDFEDGCARVQNGGFASIDPLEEAHEFLINTEGNTIYFKYLIHVVD